MLSRPSSRIIAAALIASAAGLGLGAAAVQESKPVQAPAAAKPEPKSSAKLEALSFLAGAWRGDMGGSPVEEMWSKPIGTSVMGCFRWCKPDGTPAMFEMLTITDEAGADGSSVVRLRLRHYSAVLGAKEEAEKPLTLAMKESSASRVRFEAEKDAGELAAVTYEVKDGELHIDVEFAGEPGHEREPLRFRLKKSS